ncbi:MAG: sterol desaturase family protein [Filimonas sp.]|nr:sterol desaturase family protein [Filimonas sp.]
MSINIIGFAVPFFLFFIGLEYWYAKRKGLSYYQFAESIANLNVGIAERLTDVFATGLFFYFFKFIYEHFALFSITARWYTWVILFLLTDFVWYWYHRFAHEINLFWAVHVVHHQSEDFNYTVSARITIFQAIVRSLFWSVLPLIGFPPEMITCFLLIHGLYPFFIHTQTIGKLGWLEYILVTPSHHRVHHSSNPEYLDKNYGDVLIIWDKMFGTFKKEGSGKIEYGLTKPLEHHSFLWQHFHFALEIWYSCKQLPSVGKKLRLIFGKPDNIDPDLRNRLENIYLTQSAAQKAITKPQRQYIMAQTIVTLLVLFITCLFEKMLGPLQLTLLSVFILLSVVNTGAILEQKKWVFYLEYARVLVVLAGLLYQQNSYFTLILVLGLGVFLTYYFRRAQNYYEDYLFGNKGEKP